MRKLIITFLAIFLILWITGVFLSYLLQFKAVKLPASPSNTAEPAYLEEQQEIAKETEESRKKMMDDYRYQIQKYKETLPPNPAADKF